MKSHRHKRQNYFMFFGHKDSENVQNKIQTNFLYKSHFKTFSLRNGSYTHTFSSINQLEKLEYSCRPMCSQKKSKLTSVFTKILALFVIQNKTLRSVIVSFYNRFPKKVETK